MANNVVSEFDYVIFKRDDKSRIFQIRCKRQAIFEKSKFNFDEIIGHAFGTSFEVKNGKLVKLEETKSLQLEQISAEPGADNRNLLDSERNQKMTLEDIQKMKSEGLSGEKIIEELVENSETYDSKTSFSQAKYLKKKKKKHLQIFTVLRPTPRLVMEVFAKEPAKICFLRPDTVSQMLSYSNVMYGSRIGIVESCQGLLLGFFLQRIGGGDGKVIHIVPNTNDTICRQVMNYLNFTADELNNFYSVPITYITSEESQVRDNQVQGSDTTPVTHIDKLSEDTMPDGAQDSVTVGDNEIFKMETIEDDNAPSTDADMQMKGEDEDKNVKKLKKEETIKRQKDAALMIKNKCLDSLIIACKYNPLPILMKLIHFVPPSRSVVIYCQYLEPLVQCYTQIKEKQLGCQLKLSETWLRDYQVLPNQTHPVINMSGTGGYMLTFITVCRPS